MKRTALLLAFSATAVAAQAQTTLYSNTTTFTGSGYANGGATAATPVTRLVADDISVGSGFAGFNVTQFSFSFLNFNSVAASARPLVRFYAGDGANGGPGTLLAGLNFAPINQGAGSFGVYSFNPTTGTPLFTVPSNGSFWAGISFDNVGTTTTVDQLNSFGQATYNPPTVGASGDVFFQSTNPGSFDGGNPAGGGIFFGGTPVASFGWSFRGAAPVPEPATMAVLGLGAAALLRRRKKNA